MIADLEASLAANPYDPATLINLGKLYLNTGRSADAIPLLEQATELWPDIFLAQNYLGDAYCLALQPGRAIPRYEAALALRPGDVDVLTNLSVCHWQVGEIAAAYRYGALVRDQRPVNFGLLSLLVGDYDQGWQYWEFLHTARSIDSLPQWDGSDIRERHVLVLDEEQGYGDSLMLVRFLPMLAKLCRRVTFQTRPPLLQLMRQSFAMIDVVTDVADASAFDLQVRLFSLPRLFGIRPDTIPGQPYLQAADGGWHAKLAPQGLKVGLRWAGMALNPMDRIRSIGDLGVLAPLGTIPGVTYVSLSNEPGPVPDLPILDCRDQLTDFAATAALIASLDLVISVDTGVLNLAGGLGADTWLLNYHGSDWRWGVTGDRSPWYPNVRIFRQPAMGDWASVVTAVTTALRLRLEE